MSRFARLIVRLAPALGGAPLLAALAACAPDSAGPAKQDLASPDPLLTLASEGGHYRVSLRTGPDQPPSLGVSTVELSIADRQGRPVDGLSLEVVPWMPAMGHGTSVTPTVSAEGRGAYLVTGVSLFMPGTWELRTTIDGTAHDSLAPSFDIP